MRKQAGKKRDTKIFGVTCGYCAVWVLRRWTIFSLFSYFSLGGVWGLEVLSSRPHFPKNWKKLDFFDQNGDFWKKSSFFRSEVPFFILRKLMRSVWYPSGTPKIDFSGKFFTFWPKNGPFLSLVKPGLPFLESTRREDSEDVLRCLWFSLLRDCLERQRRNLLIFFFT